MSRRLLRRAVQLVALAIIWSVHPSLASAETSCEFSWGTCVQQCNDPQAVCSQASPGCAYDGYCSGAPCEVNEDYDHVFCILNPH